MFTRDFLSRLRRRALRRGVWVRVLDGVERGILSLTCRLVDRVESEVLGVVLVGIVDKLREAMKSEFVRLMEIFGLDRVREIVRLALKWGNESSVDWARDLGFVRYLTILKVNDFNGWGIH